MKRQKEKEKRKRIDIGGGTADIYKGTAGHEQVRSNTKFKRRMRSLSDACM